MQKDNRKIYQSKEFAEAWHEHQSQKEDILRTIIMNPILIKNLGSLRGKKVLDAGCGNGFFLKYLSKLKPKELHAFDISKPLVDIAKREFKSVKFKVADLMKILPYKENSFDIVICYSVLMDLPKIKNAVKELLRITKKNGVIHIVVVHPIYNLFINDKKAQEEKPVQRIGRYTKEEYLTVNTIPGYDNFVVYRRPIAYYINEFIKNKLILEKIFEVPITEAVAKIEDKYKERIGIPVFVYFKLRK